MYKLHIRNSYLTFLKVIRPSIVGSNSTQETKAGLHRVANLEIEKKASTAHSQSCGAETILLLSILYGVYTIKQCVFSNVAGFARKV